MSLISKGNVPDQVTLCLDRLYLYGLIPAGLLDLVVDDRLVLRDAIVSSSRE